MPTSLTDLSPITARLPEYTAHARRYARTWLGGDSPACTAAAAAALARFNRAQRQPCWSEPRARVYDAVARQQRRAAVGA